MHLPGGVRPVFAIYIWSTVALGTAAVLWTCATTGAHRLAGRSPMLFAVFTALLVASELRPLKWLHRSEGGEVTASWTFAYALLLVAPAGGALAAVAFASAVSDAFHRKSLVRTLFNAGQLAVSLGAGALVLAASGHPHDLIDGRPITPAWIAAAAAAATTVFLVNGVLATTALALHQEVRLGPALRTGVGSNLATDGMLLALGPVLVIVSQRSLLILPLVLATAYAVYRTARLALTREHDATHDSLTDLVNRGAFFEAATAALTDSRRRGEHAGLALIDLNGFKGINDRLGHHVGDAVLREVAGRLRSTRRAGDIVGRLGGDEFAVLVRRPDGVAGLESAGSRLLQRIEEAPLIIEGFPLSIRASLGVALYPDHGADVHSLLERADVAMYAAKSAGTGIETYSPTGHAAESRLSLLAEVNAALDRDEMELHYQPKLDVVTGRIVGFEALLRWRHAEMGLILPARFMPLAEHTDLMKPLTTHVVRLACRQLADWQAAGRRFSIAVNISAHNLHDLSFPKVVEALLSEFQVDARGLEIEITENTVMSDPERSKVVLHELRGLGVSVAIDDFGTGYSSLASLRDLDIDAVKIDRSFVTGMVDSPSDATIVRSIIDLARNLGLRTIAEGVESMKVMERLVALGCDEVQGYLISRPAPLDQLDALVRTGRRAELDFAHSTGDVRA